MRSASEIGKIVRELRGERSLRDFAKICEISHTTIDNIEKGVDFRTGKPVQIKTSTLEKIANACHVPISYIIGDTGNQNPPENGELLENTIIWHRDGKTERKQLTKEQMDMISAMLKSIPDTPKDI